MNTFNRDPYFDNIKFILILLVVFGHAIAGIPGESRLEEAIFLTIYTFHMPVFVFISGYFSKSNKQLIKKLIIPYVIFQVTWYFLVKFILRQDDFVFYIFKPYYAMWFLLSLFVWRISLAYVSKYKFSLVLSIGLAILVGYFDHVGVYLSLSRIFTMYPFFLAGFYFRKNELTRYLSFTRNFKRSPVIVLTLFLCIIIWFYYFPINRHWLFGDSSYSSVGHLEWYAGVYRVLVYFVNVIASYCFLILVSKKRQLFSVLGEKTLITFFFHQFVVVLAKNYFYKNTLTYQHRLMLVASIVIVSFVPALISSYISAKETRIMN